MLPIRRASPTFLHSRRMTSAPRRAAQQLAMAELASAQLSSTTTTRHRIDVESAVECLL